MGRNRNSHTCFKCHATGLYFAKHSNGGAGSHSVVLTNPDGSRHGCARVVTVEANGDRHIESVPVPDVTPVPANITVPPPISTPTADDVNGMRALYRLIEPCIEERLADFQPATSYVEQVIRIVSPDGSENVISGAHTSTARLIQYLSVRENVLIVGPAGSGKTHSAKLAADALGLTFYPMSVGPQTSKSDFYGYMDAAGKYQSTVFRSWYEHGGVLLLDEMDAAHAGVLTMINAPLSGAPTAFPDGAIISHHPDAVCIASANTFGHGANRMYVGRNQLDAATLDRFIGINWDYDKELERRLCGSQTEWLDFVWQLRATQERLSIRAVFGTRRVLQGAKLLAAGVSRREVEESTVWYGVSADDRAKLVGAR